MTSESRPFTPGAALPIGLPTARTPVETSTQVGTSFGALGGTDTPRTPSAERSRPVRSADLARLDARLPDRDRDVLRVVAAHRYLTTRQIKQFVFLGHASDDSAARTARTVTKRLGTLNLLRPLERRVGGLRPGSDATVWQLAPAGARLLRRERSGYRTHLPSPRFLDHCLAVADVHLAVRSATDTPKVHGVEVHTEPDCWRRYAGPGGESRWLQPDLYARVATAAFEDRWFIEVDLGTESLPTLVSKCRQYDDYRASGIEQSRTGNFPLVLWVFSKPSRIDQLRRAVLRSQRLHPGMFRYCQPGEVARLVGAQP